MEKQMRNGLRGLAMAAALVTAGNTPAQTFPNKPIVLVVPFPPGGNTDIFARMVGNALKQGLGRPVVVDNRGGGAGGMVGSASVAKAAPDGHTLLMVPAGHMINPAVWKKLPYDTAKDFAGITIVANVPTVLVVHPALPAASVKELVALAKRRPGEINYGPSGAGLIGHAAGERFKSVANMGESRAARGDTAGLDGMWLNLRDRAAKDDLCAVFIPGAG